jgi:dihydrofolate reductase
MTTITLVYAQSRNGVIGRDGGLPWRIPSDLKRFKASTMGKPVIMGRKTWESLPRKPLPGRLNIVITRKKSFECEGATVVAGVTEALAAAGHVPEVCVIGGGEIYKQFLPIAHRIHLTTIDLDVKGDTSAPELSPSQWRVITEEHVPAAAGDSASYRVQVLERCN